MIKGILFDFAGVIGTDEFAQYIHRATGGEPAWKARLQKLANDVDSGIISNKQFVELLAQETNVTPEVIIKQVHDPVVVDAQMVDFIRTLKGNYKIGILSNYTHEWLERILQKNNLDSLFDSVYISSRYKMIKPHEEAFRRALELLGVPAEEAIFIDDRQIHVDAAKKIGIQAFLYTGLDQLQKDLGLLGVS